MIAALQLDNDTLSLHQKRDNFLGPIYSLLENNTAQAKLTTKMLDIATKFVLDNGLLYYQGSDAQPLKIAVPKVRIPEILEAFHDDTLSGHLGYKRTLTKIKERFYWPAISSDVWQKCRYCVDCARRKQPVHYGVEELRPIPIKATFDRIVMDILGPLPVTNKGNKYILIFAEYLTKWIEAVAIPDCKAETVVDTFMDKIICQFGAPKQLLSDNAAYFTASIMNQICDQQGIRRITSSGYHPQTNGLVERFNRTLENMLSIYVHKNQNNWDINLPYVIFAYNTAEQETTRFSPFYLLYGRQPKLPIEEALTENTPLYALDDNSLPQVIRRNLVRARKLALQHIQVGLCCLFLFFVFLFRSGGFAKGDWV